MVGTTISHYEILEKIGQGGMGEVFLAQDTSLDRKVALKFLPEDLQEDSTARKRLLREAKSAASLDHPYICHIHEVGEEEGKSFISMEYVQGKTLKDRLAKGPLPLTDALEKGTEIAEALEAAHSQNIIHRDLKPSNIMLTPEGHVKVMDFGLAKRLPSEETASQETTLTTGLTQTGATLGTLPYMSPEQVRGQAVDTRSDIFSFGVLFYELITGVHPFQKDSPVETANAILNEAAEPVIKYLDNAPGLLQHTVKKMLAKEPKRRYQSVHEVGTDFGELLAVGEDSFKTAPAAERSPKQWIAWGVAALSVLIGATLALWSPLFHTTLLDPPSLKRFTIDLPTPYVHSRFAAGSLRVALSPNGRHLVYVGRHPQGQAIYHREMGRVDVLPLPGTEGADRLFFSPDGQWVGFYADGKMKKVSLSGGRPRIICDVEAYLGASWGPDGNIIFGSSSGLLRVSAAGGIPKALTTPDSEVAHILPEILPSGKAVLFDIRPPLALTNRLHQSAVEVLSLETGQRKRILENGSHARYCDSGHLAYFDRDLGHRVVGFDLNKLALTGDPVSSPILKGRDYAIASREGTLVYLPSPPNWGNLVWVDRQGQTEPLMEPTRRFHSPHLSPNGKYVALTQADESQGNIWIYELGRGTLTPLTVGDFNGHSIWTPDGKRIAFHSHREGRQSIWWMAADGSDEAEELTVSHANHQWPMSWSTDGKVLALHEWRPTEQISDIWVLPLDEGERKPRLFHGTRFNKAHKAIKYAKFSPDGKWIAFHSDHSGRDEIYVKAYPASGGIKQVSTVGGTEPVWARNGKELFYRNGDKMMVVAVETTPTFKAGSPRQLFERSFFREGLPSNYDVSPDGRRFVMIQVAGTSATQLNVILNWFEELKRLAPTD